MISVENLSASFPGFSLRDVSLSIDENSFFVLLGPTGAGKTLLLEAIAGLVRVSGGTVRIDGAEVTSLPPERRGIGIVYQDYSLFPHLTVAENIRYGLRYRRHGRRMSEPAIDKLAADLNIAHLMERHPSGLSGGELQRTALARALAVEPSVLLLDEPLSALDPNFREEIREMLKRLRRARATTFLMVTHDFAEALSLADRAAVINNGAIEQAGDVRDLFQKPVSAFVADFVGIKNVFPVSIDGGPPRAGQLNVLLDTDACGPHSFMAIRPEDIVLSREALHSSMRNSFPGTVRAVIDNGFSCEVRVEAGDLLFRALVTRSALFDLAIAEGERVFCSFKTTAIHTF